MNNISGLVITRNEEKHIAECIQSLKQVCNEIIIVDSKSSDNTQAIAEKNGATVIRQAFLGDGPQRSLGLPYCNNKWVLNLDADERLDENCVQQINNLDLSRTSFDTFTFKRKNHVGSKWVKYAGWYPDIVSRLFNKEIVDFSQVKIHTRIESQNSKDLDCDIIHFSFQDLEDMLNRLNTYSSWSASQLHNKGKKATIFTPLLHGLFFFINSFFFRLGFLHGQFGLSICLAKSMASYMKYAKLLELNSR